MQDASKRLVCFVIFVDTLKLLASQHVPLKDSKVFIGNKSACSLASYQLFNSHLRFSAVVCVGCN